MDLNWLQAILYGFAVGFTEIIPVSAQAHEAVLSRLFGVDRQYFLRVFITVGVLAALIFSCSGQLGRIRREIRLSRLPVRRRKRPPEQRILMEVKLLRLVAVPMLLILFLRLKLDAWADRPMIVAGMLLLNGLILYLPERFPQGNKDARNLSRFDGLLIGLGGALGVLPGVSRVGAALSAAGLRGTGKQFALETALLLSVPALMLLLLLDIVLLAGAGIGGITAGAVFLCMLAGLSAGLGAYCGILVMRFLAVKVGFSGFAYYSWGLALFTFILYLIT